jgi:hypothetical protein
MSAGIRRHTRHLIDARVQISWINEQGHHCFVRGRCLDVSRTGVKVSVFDPIPTRTIVSLEIEHQKFRGAASVRSCTRSGMNFHLGLEFGSGLRFPVPQDALTASGDHSKDANQVPEDPEAESSEPELE